ncbi:MAG: hypothetical protein K0M55_19440 [Rhizobium sp.]|nr:hypothetical protein [Rhizobium sp.]
MLERLGGTLMIDRYERARDIWKAKLELLRREKPHELEAISRVERRIDLISKELDDFYRRDEERR